VAGDAEEPGVPAGLIDAAGHVEHGPVPVVGGSRVVGGGWRDERTDVDHGEVVHGRRVVAPGAPMTRGLVIGRSGGCGIGTHGDPEATTAFEAAPFVRSGNPPATTLAAPSPVRRTAPARRADERREAESAGRLFSGGRRRSS